MKMHETAKRLLEIGLENGASTFTDITRRLGASDQSSTNWKTRGVPKKEIIKAAKMYGASAAYLLEGTLPKYVKEVKETPIELGQNVAEYKAPKSKRDLVIEEITSLLQLIDDFGLGAVLQEAKRLAKENQSRIKQTAS